MFYSEVLKSFLLVFLRLLPSERSCSWDLSPLESIVDTSRKWNCIDAITKQRLLFSPHHLSVLPVASPKGLRRHPRTESTEVTLLRDNRKEGRRQRGNIKFVVKQVIGLL